MAATIAHQINNPLEAVLNLVYLLRPLVGTSEETYLNAAEIELTRVAHIAKQTLGYYREHTSAVPASICQLAEHALTEYSARCYAYNISIERHLGSDAKLTIRRGEIMQVISNLIANAIYAMPEGGKLNITVSDVNASSPGVLLTVEDNGVGIPPENLEKVFDAFFTTRVTIGTGIGLFVARQFVEGHAARSHSKAAPPPKNTRPKSASSSPSRPLTTRPPKPPPDHPKNPVKPLALCKSSQVHGFQKDARGKVFASN